MIIRWLDRISVDAREIYLVGDIFDYWFEYRHVVPKGYFRLFHKLNELIESGIPIHFFKGNHDLWQYEYLERDIGVTMHHGPYETTIDGSQFFIAHGDGLGPGDIKYKVIKGILTNRMCQRLFSILHPNFGLSMMRRMSHKSRNGHTLISSDPIITNQQCITFCKEHLATHPNTHYYVMGHWHHPLIHPIGPLNYYINLGDWVSYFSYGVWNGSSFDLAYYQE